jgi:ubiquinone/menaquinone biosynthesis C-methylase UbiE
VLVDPGERDPMIADSPAGKGYKGLAMEGSVARRYTKLRETPGQIAGYRRQAAQLTAGLADGAHVLEVAPGPGFLTIELARFGRFRVTGLDISHTFVQIAGENARKAGVHADFRQGDASAMDLADNTFDLILCQAAFKNFSRPGAALNEMHRVLRVGGVAIVQDLRADASNAAIRDEVATMGLGRFGSLLTRRILGGLRRRAYTPDQFAQLAAASKFGRAEIRTTGVEVETRLRKQPPG